MEKRDILLTIFILLLVFVIFQQVRIVKVILDNKEQLDTDPLAFSARKYNIPECTCFLSNEVSIYFNKTGSKTIIQKKGVEIPSFNPDIFGGLVENGTTRDT